MSRLISMLRMLVSPKGRIALKNKLRENFYPSLWLDCLLNLITPLKIRCPNGTIKGISRWKLRWSYTGLLRVSPDNLVEFVDVKDADARNWLPVCIDIRGSGNVFTVKGKMNSLPKYVIMGGTGNRVEVGSDFYCEAKNLLWVVTGKNNLIRIGDRVRFLHRDARNGGKEHISFTGESCSLEIGNHCSVMLTMDTEPNSSYDFHMKVGENSGMMDLYVDMASACKLTIGKGFFCSWGTYIWCGAHALLDADGNVLNDCKEITIGNDVWFGHGVEVPGAVTVADGCIIGSGVTLIQNVLKPRSIVTVAPAKVYPVNVRWDRRSPIMVQRNMEHEFFGSDSGC